MSVRSLTCYDRSGNVLSFDEIDDIVRFTLSFDCPLCGAEQDTEKPFHRNVRHTCSACTEHYHLLPLSSLSSTPLEQVDARQQIQMQLRSVSVAHSFASDDRRLASRVTGLPSTLLYGGPPSVLGLIGLIGLGVTGQGAFGEPLLALTYALTVAAFASGLAFVIFDAYGAFLLVAEYVDEEELGVTKVEFILCVGNCIRYPPFGYATGWWRPNLGWGEHDDIR